MHCGSAALVLSLSGVKLLDPPGANAIVLTVITIALVVGLSFAARWSSRRALPPVAHRTRLGAGAHVTWPPGAAGAAVLRFARPTDRLDEVITFYRDGLGLAELGRFEGHSGYDGVMLGLPGSDVHLEFTSHADGSACPAPSADNLLVLYVESEQAAELASGGSQTWGTRMSSPRTVWDGRSITIADPDGWRVVLDWGLAES